MTSSDAPTDEQRLSRLLGELRGRKGKTKPRIGTKRTKKLKTLGPVLSRVSELAGYELMPWQKYHNDVAYEVNPDGLWAHPEVVSLAGRQSGKTLLVIPRVLAGLFIFDEPLILHTAQNRAVPRELFDQLVDIIMNVPEFRKHIPTRGGIVSSNGREAITTDLGTSYRVMAPTQAAFRSWSATLLIFDEAREQRDNTLWSAAVPTQRAVHNPQRLILSNAGDVDSVVLNDLQDRGRLLNPEDTMAYLEWSAPDGCDLMDADGIQQANPALGYILRPEAIIDELRALSPQAFRTEILCQRVRSETEVPVVDPDDWARNVMAGDVELAPGVDGVWMGVDIDPEHSKAAIVMVAWVGDNMVCDLVSSMNNPTEEEVAAEAIDIASEWKPIEIVYDPFTSSGIAERINAKGWNTQKVVGVNYFTACGRFYDAVSSGTLLHPGNPELTADIEAANRNATGDGGWALSRKRSAVSIPATAALVRAVYAASKPRSVLGIG